MSAQTLIDVDSDPAPNQTRAALWLGLAGGVEYLMQLLLPVILVRTLSSEGFGWYRAIWLLAGTAVAIFPLFIPQSLFYFLPRSGQKVRGKIFANSLLLMLGLGLLAGVLTIANWSILPVAFDGGGNLAAWTSLFVTLWVFTSVLDVMAVADGQATWQAKVVASAAVIRSVLLGATAVVTKDMRSVLVAMCLFALLKLFLISLYLARFPGLNSYRPDRSLLRVQLRYVLPFAAGSALFLLRGQADQWVVASYFGPSSLALVGIAAVALAIATVVRNPVVNALLPKVSALVGAGNTSAAKVVIGESYRTLSLVLLPVLGVLYLCATEVIELVYTSAYVGAAPLMRIYLVGQVAAVFASGHLLSVLGRGRASMVISGLSLLISIATGVASIKMFGLVGGAVGSVVALAIGELLALSVVARSLQCSAASLICLRFSFKVFLAVLAAIATTWWALDHVTGLELAWRLSIKIAIYGFVLACSAQLLGVIAPSPAVFEFLRPNSRQSGEP